MHRLVSIIVVAAMLTLPRHASAEYRWVAWVKETTMCTAQRVGACWSSCRDATSAATRRCVQRAADWWEPDARQKAAARCGLRLPETLADDQRLVVLIHGLDSDTDYWHDLLPLLEGEGYAVAPLAYPNDQPVAESARLLAAEMARLHAKYPRLESDIVAHSMGSIIARAYLEGDDYAGGVRRVVLLAPPNHGSCYSRFSGCCDAIEHFRLWRTQPDWSWTWMVTDGLGEARSDIAPGSSYLTALLERNRREGVRYTIVAGNRSCGWRYCGNVLRCSTACLPQTRWAGNLRDRMHSWATDVEARESTNDGLVTIESARLAGVDDFVVVPADHTTLVCSRNERPPVAWPVIKDRLAR